MTLKKMFLLLGVLILSTVVIAACTSNSISANLSGAAISSGPASAAAPAAVEAPADPAVPIAVVAQTAATPTLVQFETCSGCHADSGSTHQAYYKQLNQDGVIKVSNVTYRFTPGTGDKKDTALVTFRMTKDGKPISGASVENSNIYYAAYNGKTFEGGDRLSLKGKLTFDAATGVTTSTLTELDSTDKAYVDYTDLSKGGGIIVVYGYDKQVGSLPERIKQVQFPYAAIQKIGTVNYASLANNAGCEKCHSDPYLKHGNIYAEVNGDPKTDFITCKACHLDDGEGGHFEWQLNATDPEAAAAFLKAGEESATPEIKAKYAYKTTLMNDVHMSHAMEFPYPQSMSNCVTCHEGKLDQVLSDANFNVATCKSCHPVTGTVKKDGDTVIFDTTKLALKTILPEGIHGKMDLEKTDCASCHGAGKSAKTFNQIHTGYDKVIYTAAGKKISDIVKVTIDKATFAENKLTIDFSATSSEDIGLDVKTIQPTVMVGLYGWDTKDYLVGPHEKPNDTNGDGKIDRADEPLLEAVAGSKHSRITTVSAADGKWQVTADLKDWADLVKNGSVKRVEIAVMPALNNADKAMVALNAPSRTFDLTTGRFNDQFYSPIVKVTDGCDTCHEALGTTFHTPDRGGNAVVCRMCHITKAGGAHLEMQSRSLDSYIHSIHASQQFDIASIDFTDPAQAEKYALDSELPFPKHGITNCEACHIAGTYDVPSQSKSMPGILSASADKLKGMERTIGTVPSVVVGPASRACGSCHRAELINEDNAKGLTLLNMHIAQYGYQVEAGDKPTDTLTGIFDQIMSLFK